VIIKDPTKSRNGPKQLFSTRASDVLDDANISLVVELIDDADAAYAIVCQALKSGKSVVSANKKMIAEHHAELISLSVQHNVSFLYEAAVCGSVPIIRNLEEYFDNDMLTHIQGIVNGSTNYILSKMYSENQTYDVALKDAQEKGFAERDPSLDVDGVDAAYKLSILCLHAFGKHIDANFIVRKGITSLHPFDFQYAKEKGNVIKLIATCETDDEDGLTSLSVFPSFVDQHHSLGLTHNEYNGVLVGSTLADEQFFHGKGAGRYPTSSAVLSDISAVRYGYKYEYKKGHQLGEMKADQIRRFYIGYDKDVVFDDSVFESVEERFVGQERGYIIGDISIHKLQKSTLLSDQSISIISWN